MSIAVIGLGAMGLGIVQVFAQAGHVVEATDLDPAMRESAPDRLATALAPRVAKGAITPADRDAILGRLKVVPAIAKLSPAELVIEAVAERLAVKKAVFGEIEPLMPADTVLATNTSSLSVTAIAAGLARPQQLVGLHFFNPAPAMKLVELVAHEGSAPAALARARDLTARAGKTVIACADQPGFIVNRCARPYYGEALALLEEGRSAGEIDAAMTAAGYPLGPFALIDLIGADINLAATEGLSAAMGGHPRYHVFDALRAAVQRGDLGRKTGRGLSTGTEPPPADAAMIARRIEATLANEAGWLLSGGGVEAKDIDTALRLGLNFPRGPFEALANYGRDEIRATLDALEAAAPPALKGRYLPASVIAGP